MHVREVVRGANKLQFSNIACKDQRCSLERKKQAELFAEQQKNEQLKAILPEICKQQWLLFLDSRARFLAG
jgi:hypothetical protein